MNVRNKIREKSMIIATHVYATGPSHALEKYLQVRVKKLLFIGHPFVFANDKRSHTRFYERGYQKKNGFYSLIFQNQIISTCKDFLLTFIWSIQFGNCDVFIGVDNSNAFIGILLRKIGLVTRVIYYTIDYVPQRFENKLLNSLYHFLDRFAVQHSDTVWNLSEIMVWEREHRGIGKEFRKKQIVVPVGTESTVNVKDFHTVKRYHVAHMGHLIKKQGVQLIIKAIPLIMKDVPRLHVEIIGGGAYENELKKLAAKLHVSRYITFHGFIEDHERVEDLLSQCALGLAPYTESDDNYVRYTDPGKIKAYLAAGLPIIITRVPAVWKYITRERCGTAISYSVKELSKAVITILKNKRMLEAYRERAKQVSKKFTWDKIFTRALGRSI